MQQCRLTFVRALVHCDCPWCQLLKPSQEQLRQAAAPCRLHHCPRGHSAPSTLPLGQHVASACCSGGTLTWYNSNINHTACQMGHFRIWPINSKEYTYNNKDYTGWRFGHPFSYCQTPQYDYGTHRRADKSLLIELWSRIRQLTHCSIVSRLLLLNSYTAPLWGYVWVWTVARWLSISFHWLLKLLRTPLTD